MKLAVAAIALAALTAAGCTSAPAPAASVAAPAAAPSSPAPAAVPVLRPGRSVTFADSSARDAGSTPERETWELTSVSYISRTAALAGGADDDVPADLGADPPRPGDRYLVLGLTITDDGPAGFTNPGWTVSDATYSWSEADGSTGSTGYACLGQSAPGSTQPYPQFVSDMCVVNGLAPGQHISGHVFFEVPDAPAAVTVFGQVSGAPLVVIDPGGVCRAAKSC
ncbi:MAG TPA: hypothetical protein VHZ03_14225 [Trebonia sp.]|nr:hypothetical protein [Trebonia sp.]